MTSVKGFSQTWIRPCTNSIKKDAVKSHIKSAVHEKAVNLQKKTSNASVTIFPNRCTKLADWTGDSQNV